MNSKIIELSERWPVENHPNQGRPTLVSVCASEIAMKPIDWLWPGRIARGKHTCIAGEPGASKSQLSTFIAATVTTGGLWPCGEGRSQQGSVLILSAEDGAADTIVPRLHAAEADLGRIQIINAVKEDEERRGLNLQHDLALLETECNRIGDVLLIIIDPISSYLGKADSHKNADVRRVLEPVGEFAERLNVAILSIIGSIAFVGAPRVALAVIEEDGRRLLLHAKNNLAPKPLGLAYTIEEVTVAAGITSSRVAWEGGHITISADEAMRDGGGRKAPERDEAEEFLKRFLSDGPKKQAEIEEASFHAPRTLRRAAENLGVEKRKQGMSGGWVWSLPTT